MENALVIIGDEVRALLENDAPQMAQAPALVRFATPQAGHSIRVALTRV